MLINDRYEAMQDYVNEQKMVKLAAERRRQNYIQNRCDQLIRESNCTQHCFSWLCSSHDGPMFACDFCEKVVYGYEIENNSLLC